MSGAAIASVLTEAGLWPATGGWPMDSPPVEPGGDLLPAICRAWNHCAESLEGHARSAAAAMAESFQRAQNSGARLTWGVPGVDLARTTTWLGSRLAWWPNGVPDGHRVGIVSSRLGQELDGQQAWFAVLRTACMRLDPRSDLLVTAGQTAAQRFVQRCGRLFALPVLTVEVDRDDASSWQAWGRQVSASVSHLAASKPEALARGCRAHPLATALGSGAGVRNSHASLLLSPPLPADPPLAALEELADLPAPDRAVLALSDRILALHVRGEGNMMRLLRARLRLPGFSAASVFLALGSELVPRERADELLDAGGVGWYLMNAAGEHEHRQASPWASADLAARPPAPIIPCPAAESWGYLTHCTRRRVGPWPGEDEDQFLDDLILDREGADHSALATLWRIVRSGRLIASNEFVRGQTPVVSFTAVPLSEIRSLRTYRSHLGRWDFEPYGICIRRDWLQRCGARPVQYGDDPLWDALPAADRPFFQKHESHTSSGKRIDWTTEREWRLVGDMDLGEIPAVAALLFVPSEGEAQQLAATSPWPIVVLAGH